MVAGQVIYGVDGRRDYAFGPLAERALFRLGADIDRLLPIVIDPGDGRLGADDLPDLPLCDYELILAHFYSATFGETVAQNVDCSHCGKKFSVEFPLGAWVRQVRDTVMRDEARAFDGVPYALPTRAILSSIVPDRESLARRLRPKESPLPPERMAAFEAHIAEACPVLRDDIEAPCPRCGETEHKHFVLRRHLAARLAARLQAFLHEIHVLASSYHWSAADILDLPRQTRRALVDTIRNQSQRRRALGSG